MKTISYIALAIGAASLAIGIISRFTINPVNFQGLIPGVGLEAQAFLAFANTCLLTAIATALLEMLKSKQ